MKINSNLFEGDLEVALILIRDVNPLKWDKVSESFPVDMSVRQAGEEVTFTNRNHVCLVPLRQANAWGVFNGDLLIVWDYIASALPGDTVRLLGTLDVSVSYDRGVWWIPDTLLE